jgi:HlyD family secretion protein
MTTVAASSVQVAVHFPAGRRWKLGVGALLVAGALGGAAMWVREHAAARHAPTFRFETTKADCGPIRAKVTATGTVNPIVTVQVGSQVSGTIQALGADFSSVVKPGQMMAQIDPRLFKAAVQQGEANVLSARATILQLRAQLGNARKQAERNRHLLAQKFVAQQDVDTTDTAAEADAAQLKAAEAGAAQAEAALTVARTNLAYTTIKAPVNGIVISRNVDVGQTVASTFAAPTLFLVGEDLTKMQVDTNIAEADVGRLLPGMKATFTVDAYPAELFVGRIREVRNAPQVIQNVVTYDAVVDVTNAALKLKPGMTANIEITYGERASVMRVPNAGIRFRPPAEFVGRSPPVVPLDRRLVWVEREGGRLEPVLFKPGVSDGVLTEVLDGKLQVDDLVVTEAISNRNGTSAVRIL